MMSQQMVLTRLLHESLAERVNWLPCKQASESHAPSSWRGEGHHIAVALTEGFEVGHIGLDKIQVSLYQGLGSAQTNQCKYLKEGTGNGLMQHVCDQDPQSYRYVAAVHGCTLAMPPVRTIRHVLFMLCQRYSLR